MTTHPNDLLLLPVKLNGIGPYIFVLDTGASCCCISFELAKALKIKRRRKLPASGANSPLLAHHGLANSISIGKAVRRKVDLAIFDFSVLKKVDQNINGIIGYNFLCRYIVSINYKLNEVLFYK